MSLFGSIQLARNALQAAQIGLQVAGNNISNANTPGYIREEVSLTPATAQQLGSLTLGLGVHVAGVIQKIDRLLDDRLRSSTSELASGEAQENAYLQLETAIGELSDGDLSSSLSAFVGSINDVLNQPESVTVRSLAALQGEKLATDIRSLRSGMVKMQTALNREIDHSAPEINKLLEEIAKLNMRIVTLEGGVVGRSDAVGLRDQRYGALTKLAEMIDFRAIEQPDGSVSVTVGGDQLVSVGTVRRVKSAIVWGSGGATELRVEDTDSPLGVTSGRVAGLMASRDDVLGDFVSRLDEFAETLIFEFNKVFSSGQGLSGYDEVLSEFGVDSVDAPLDQAGLPFSPAHGSFQVLVRDRRSGATETTDVWVDLSGLDDDTSLSDLAAQLDAINGLHTQINSSHQLQLEADSPELEFSFAEDTSGVLAALGLGTFFSGSSAQDIGVQGAILQDPGKFAASRNGIGSDTQNAVLLAGFLGSPLSARDGQSLAEYYDQFMLETSHEVAAGRSVAEGLRVFQRSLEGQHLGVSGVNIDDEAVKMITFQRAYQAAARYIGTISELLADLVRL